MEALNSPYLWSAVLVGVALIAAYYYWSKGTSRKKAAVVKKSNKGILCRIADCLTARISNEYITKAQAKEIKKANGGSLGREFDREGQKVIYLQRVLEEALEDKPHAGTPVLKPIPMPTGTGLGPLDLFNNIHHVEKLVHILITELMKDDQKPFFEQYGVYLWWIAVMGFIAFMWANAG